MAKAVERGHSRLILHMGSYTLLLAMAMSGSFAYTQWIRQTDIDANGDTQRSPMSAGSPFVLPQAPEISRPQTTWLLEKPLFLESRIRPTQQQTPPLAQAAAEPNDNTAMPNYVVGGIVIAPPTRKALLRAPNNKSGRWLDEGQTTPDGWTIQSVAADSVVLTNGPRRFVVYIYPHSAQRE